MAEKEKTIAQRRQELDTEAVVAEAEGADYARLWRQGKAALRPSAQFPWQVTFIRSGNYRAHYLESERLALDYASIGTKSNAVVSKVMAVVTTPSSVEVVRLSA